MVLPNRMSLHPGLLWVALNLTLIIQCLSRNNIYIYFFFRFYQLHKMFSRTPLRCIRLSTKLSITQFEDHCHADIYVVHMHTHLLHVSREMSVGAVPRCFPQGTCRKLRTCLRALKPVPMEAYAGIYIYIWYQARETSWTSPRQ
jgi:hypothetical protein